jgi:quercetin 2,3-dioxygenase
MIEVRLGSERGRSDQANMNTLHSFTYGEYQDPAQPAYGVLEALNESWLAPEQSLIYAPCRDMDIISYVMEGSLEHKDGLGNEGLIRPGDLQLLGVGSGLEFRETNPSATDSCHLLQLWIATAQSGSEPRYEQRHFQNYDSKERIFLLASPDGRDSSVTLQQDAYIYNIILNAGEVLRQSLPNGRRAYLHIARGTVIVNEQSLQSGDGARISAEQELVLTTPTRGEALLIELT